MILICTTHKQGYDYIKDNDLDYASTHVIPYEPFRSEGLMGLELREGEYIIIDPFIQTLLTRIR